MINGKVVLVTGARAPSGLDVIRVLGSSGFRVVATDTFSFPIGKYSKYCDNFFTTPSPSQCGKTFVEALSKICSRENVTHLLSICEEAVHISQHKELLPTHIQSQVTNFDHMLELHHKGKFIQLTKDIQVNSPQTQVMTESWSFHQQIEKFVIKPNYSRFGTEIKVVNKQEAIAIHKDSGNNSICLQEFISGRPVSSLAFSQDGHVSLVAHYKANYYSGKAAINFIPFFSTQLDENIKNISQRTNYSGFIGLDYIESESGNFFALECNPRCTSGFHFFRSEAKTAEYLLGLKASLSPLKPQKSRQYQLFFAMLSYGLLQAIKNCSLHLWAKDIWRADSVIFCRSDLKPVWGQFFTLFYFICRGLRLGIGPIESSVVDIKWEENEVDF